MKTEQRPCPATKDWREFLESSDWRRERFFAVLTPEIPHVFAKPPQEYKDLYADVGGLIDFQNIQYPMTTWLDELVWEILRPLEQLGLKDETLVLFFVDNGFNSTSLLRTFLPELDRAKGSLYSLGFRTPFIFRWPKGGVTGGRRYEDLVTLADIFETLLRVTRSPRNLRRVPARGQQLLRRLRRGKPLRAPREMVITQMGKPGRKTYGRIATTPRWRYIQDLKNGREELYAIDVDPHEENDLAPEASEALLGSFRARIEDWLEEGPS